MCTSGLEGQILVYIYIRKAVGTGTAGTASAVPVFRQDLKNIHIKSSTTPSEELKIAKNNSYQIRPSY